MGVALEVIVVVKVVDVVLVILGLVAEVVVVVTVASYIGDMVHIRREPIQDNSRCLILFICHVVIRCMYTIRGAHGRKVHVSDL